MSHPSHGTWRRLLELHKVTFQNHGHPLPPEIISETAFRSHFESLSRKYGDKYPAHALFKLHNNGIDSFTSAIDTVLGLKPPNTLAGLMYGGIFIVSQYAYSNASVRQTDIIELLGQLNRAVPRLAADIPRFPDDAIVQQPLQDIFSTYIERLIFLARCLSTASADFDPRTPHNVLNYEEVVRIFDQGRLSFEAALQRAEQEIYPRAFFPGHEQYTNGVMSTAKDPYDTQARFKTIRRLGRGSFGQVDEVEEISTGNIFARKNIPLGSNGMAARQREEQIKKEFRIMEKLTHVHITTVLFWLRSDTVCSIFMKPACDMDLRCYLENCVYNNYPPDDLKRMIAWPGCLMHALAFAHRSGITHKDIKPSNILIKDSHVYLADFGMAKDDVPDDRDRNGSYSVWGASVYRAPEIQQNRPQAPGNKADVFSLGCAFSEMLTVCCRHSLEDYQESRKVETEEGETIAFRANLALVNTWLDNLRGVDSVIDQLVWHTKSMLREDPERRATADQGIILLQALSEREILFCPLHY